MDFLPISESHKQPGHSGEGTSIPEHVAEPHSVGMDSSNGRLENWQMSYRPSIAVCDGIQC